MTTGRNLNEVKALLEGRRAKLLERLGAVNDALGETRDRDLEEQATEREGDEVLELMGRADRHEVAAVDAALARIEEGEYGFCTRCGDEIAPARLEALPETPFCQKCASEI